MPVPPMVRFASLETPPSCKRDFASRVVLSAWNSLQIKWYRPLNVLLFANGELKRGLMLDRVLASLDSPRVICADGGALHARALGLTPHTDHRGSRLAQRRASHSVQSGQGAEIIQHPPEKDETDLELALHYCRQTGAKSIQILGALGGRFDQTIANILLLTPSRAFAICASKSSTATRRSASCGPARIGLTARAAIRVSLIPLSSMAQGIRTRWSPVSTCG